MYLKTLPFNKTLFKKDFNMVKILAFSIAAILFVSITVYLLSIPYSLKSIEKYHMEEGIEYNKDDLIKAYKDEINWRLTDEETIVFLLVLVPIGLVAILFGEEKRMKTFEVLSVMPYKKYEIFFNKLLVALLAMALPFVINGAIMLLALGLSPSLRMFYSAKQILIWIVSNVYYQLPILSFSLIIGAITGTTISQVILTVIFLAFPIGFPLLIAYNLEMWGVYDYAIFSKIDKLINYTSIGVLFSPPEELKHYIIFILLSIGMIIIAKILFDKSRIERNRETLEFEKTEGFFKFGVSICTALLMGLIFFWIFESFNFKYGFFMYGFSKVFIILIGYILGGALGYFVANYSIKFNRSKQ